MGLVVGGSGFLGQYLVPALAAQYPDQTIHTLARGQHRTIDDGQAQCSRSASARSEAIICGDICCPDLGLQDKYFELCDEVTDVYHLAANTQFSADKMAVHRINVEGTRNVIKFVQEANRRKRQDCRLHFVSTAYVCGRHAGVFYEDDLTKGQLHNNDYEESKFLAESLVRAAASDIPATVYRPSIIVGASIDGWSNKFGGFYDIVSWLQRGWLKSFPAPPEAQIDIITADYVAAAIASLSCRPTSNLVSYALVSGADLAPDIFTLIRSAEAVLMRHGAKIRELSFTPIRGHTAESRTDLLRQVVANPRILRPLTFLLPYMEGATQFDATRARRELRRSGLFTPIPRDYIDTIIDYAVDCNFGRKKGHRDFVRIKATGPSQCDMSA